MQTVSGQPQDSFSGHTIQEMSHTYLPSVWHTQVLKREPTERVSFNVMACRLITKPLSSFWPEIDPLPGWWCLRYDNFKFTQICSQAPHFSVRNRRTYFKQLYHYLYNNWCNPVGHFEWRHDHLCQKMWLEINEHLCCLHSALPVDGLTH